MQNGHLQALVLINKVKGHNFLLKTKQILILSHFIRSKVKGYANQKSCDLDLKTRCPVLGHMISN